MKDLVIQNLMAQMYGLLEITRAVKDLNPSVLRHRGRAGVVVSRAGFEPENIGTDFAPPRIRFENFKSISLIQINNTRNAHLHFR